jgi:hypothetical protein
MFVAVRHCAESLLFIIGSVGSNIKHWAKNAALTHGAQKKPATFLSPALGQCH